MMQFHMNVSIVCGCSSLGVWGISGRWGLHPEEITVVNFKTERRFAIKQAPHSTCEVIVQKGIAFAVKWHSCPCPLCSASGFCILEWRSHPLNLPCRQAQRQPLPSLAEWHHLSGWPGARSPRSSTKWYDWSTENVLYTTTLQHNDFSGINPQIAATTYET